jgi:WD40 repeat protein
VWALGVIMYEALTGEKPFYDKDYHRLLKLVLTAAPMPPRAAVPAVPRDLELICLKCLSKSQHERYPSAKELADDIERFLRGEPIRARPAGRVERAVKWARRNPVVTGATAAVALALVAGSAVSIYFGLDARNEARRATRESDKAKTSEADALNKGNELTRVNGDLVRTVDDLGKTNDKLAATNREKVRQLVGLTVAAADERINAGDPVAALPGLVDGLATLEAEKVHDADLERALRIKFAAITALAPKPVRVWVEPDAVVHAELSADGSRVLTVNRDGTARVTDATTGELVRLLRAPTDITRAALSPDGARVVTGERTGRVILWDAVTGKEVAPPVALGKPVLHVAFSADGRRFLAAGGQLYAARTLDTVGKVTLPKSPRGYIRVWDAATEPGGAFPQVAFFGANGWINHAAFAPDGAEVAFASACSPGDGKPLVSLGALVAEPKGRLRTYSHGLNVLRVAYSHDGTQVVAACGGLTANHAGAEVRDVATGEPVGQPLAHDKSVTLASFNTSGALVLTGSDDGTARLWDAKTSQAVSPPLAHRDRVTAAEFSPDGTLLLTAGRDGAIRLWHATLVNGKAGDPAAPPLPHSSPVLSASWSRDGTRILAACENGVVRLWDVAGARARAPAYRTREP